MAAAAGGEGVTLATLIADWWSVYGVSVILGGIALGFAAGVVILAVLVFGLWWEGRK